MLVPRLVVPDERGADTLYLTLTEWAGEQGLTLYPHQDEALIELLGGSNVVLATPTPCTSPFPSGRGSRG